MNWKTWLKGLAAVAAGGAATGVANALTSGRLNREVAVTAGMGALSTVLAYLMRSPLLGKTEAEAAAPVEPEDEPDFDTAA